MKFGWHRPWREFYDATFEHMQEVERLGFDKIGISEHHGNPDGYNIDMPVTLAIAADRTPYELNLMAIKPGMTFDESLEYLKNFAEKVIPAVKHL